MQVRADLAKEWLDEKEARFRQFTDRFVDLRVRYINQLDAEITGRALAKRTFDTSYALAHDSITLQLKLNAWTKARVCICFS